MAAGKPNDVRGEDWFVGLLVVLAAERRRVRMGIGWR